MLIPNLQQHVAVVGLPGTFVVVWVDRYRECADLVADDTHGEALLRDVPLADLLPIEATQLPYSA